MNYPYTEAKLTEFLKEAKMRVERICKLCPETKKNGWCKLLNSPIGIAAISADCPFEHLEPNGDNIHKAIEVWKLSKNISSLVQNS